MDTPLTARHLKEISTDLEWTQQDWADRTGIDRTYVSSHLAAKRPIRDEHLAAYVRAVPGIDKQRLLSAWIRDVFDADDLPRLLNEDGHIHEDAANWLPGPNEEQRSELLWLAGERVKDSELDKWLATLLRRLGYERKAPDAESWMPRPTTHSCGYGHPLADQIS